MGTKENCFCGKFGDYGYISRICQPSKLSRRICSDCVTARQNLRTGYALGTIKLDSILCKFPAPIIKLALIG